MDFKGGDELWIDDQTLPTLVSALDKQEVVEDFEKHKHNHFYFLQKRRQAQGKKQCIKQSPLSAAPKQG